MSTAIGNLSTFLESLDLPGFVSDGLCAQTDPDLFFPYKGESCNEAKRVCTACPVRVECLEYALERDERYGVWGGTSERQRQAIRVERRQAEGRAVA